MEQNPKENENRQLQLLGIGSAKNRALKANLIEALEQLQLQIPIEEVQSINELLKYDIAGIPALVVNGRVVFQRVVPSVEDLKIVLSVLLEKEKAGKPVKRILIPVDFSETAENALLFGFELANLMGAHISVVHVHNNPSELESTLLLERSSDITPIKKRLLDALCQRVSKVVSSNPLYEDLEIETEVINGQVAREICRLSDLKNSDLIVMGTTGEGKLLGQWFGSVSTQVSKCVQSPVLLVPDQARFKGFSKVVYASDYHPSEKQLLPKLVSFIHPFNSTVFFAHINRTRKGASPSASNYQNHVFHQNSVTFQLTTIDSDDIVEGLSRFAEEADASLMIMTKPQRNFIEDLFHKSTTREMIFNTRIPLMILHD